MCALNNLRDLCSTKQKIKTKNDVAEIVSSVLAEKVLLKHKENSLSINSKHSVLLEKGIIE